MRYGDKNYPEHDYFELREHSDIAIPVTVGLCGLEYGEDTITLTPTDARAMAAALIADADRIDPPTPRWRVTMSVLGRVHMTQISGTLKECKAWIKLHEKDRFAGSVEQRLERTPESLK